MSNIRHTSNNVNLMSSDSTVMFLWMTGSKDTSITLVAFPEECENMPVCPLGNDGPLLADGLLLTRTKKMTSL